MSGMSLFSYATLTVILYFCVKRWLLARTILGWFSVAIFSLMIVAGASQRRKLDTTGYSSAQLIGLGVGELAAFAVKLGGIGLSLWWVRKNSREWGHRRRSSAE